MRFDIDTPRAKTLATRLQAFLADNPKPKLSRSSAIEAVARMLGFNNRNEMLARLNEAPAESVAAPSPEASVGAALTAFLDAEITAQARRLVALGRANLPEGDFSEAMHADSADGHAMLAAEESISTRLDRDHAYRRALTGALAMSEEFESCRNERISDNDALAMALVNAALPVAEDLWHAPRDEVADAAARADADGIARWQARIDAAADAIAAALRDGMAADEEVTTRATALATEMGEPVGRLVADLRQAFIARHGQTPETAEAADAARDWLSWDVDVSAWVPASLRVELTGDRVGEIEAEVLCIATIQVDASDEEDALRRAKLRLEAEHFDHIWKPRPDGGVRDAYWATEAREGDPDAFLAREENLAEDHWSFRVAEVKDFRADQVVDMSE